MKQTHQMKGLAFKKLKPVPAWTLAICMAASSAMPTVAVQATTTAEVESGTGDQSAAADTDANATGSEDSTEEADAALKNAGTGSAETGTVTDELTEELEVVVEGETVTQEDGDWMSNEDMLDGYVTELIQGYGISTLGTSAGDILSDGIEKSLYALLKEKIESVATGEVSYTVFTISLEDLGLDGSYSADELGVSSIFDEQGSITSEASSALMNKLGVSGSISTVMDALLTDCPYDLYWYDKTSTGGSKTRYWMSATSTLDGESYLELTSIEYSMSVASAYQDSTVNESKYTVNNSAVESAKKAIENAQAIVEQYASYTDYEKLKAYLNEIKNWTSYNYDAASDDYSDGYGDPWQLIYVFDGDENTTVVCEGYSKAFQYLCDLSTFNDDDLYCYTVSGEMSGGTGEGPHMWDIVHTSQGNYLVDVTNCDTGTIGADDQLFMICAAGGTIGGNYQSSTGGNLCVAKYTFSLNNGNSSITYTYDSDIVSYYGDYYAAAYLNLAETAYIPEVVKADPEVTVTAYTGTYDGSEHEAVTIDGTGETVTYSTDGGENWTTTVPTIKDAGTLSVMVKVAETDTYKEYTTTVTAKVTKKAVTVTAVDASRTYGEANPNFTYTITGEGLAGNDTKDDLGITLSTTATENSAVGSYPITGTAESTNYAVTIENGTLTVTKANGAVKVNTASYTKSYENETFNLEFETVGDGTVTYSSSNTSVVTVDTNGTVTIDGAGNAVITVTLAEGTNYTGASGTISVTVAKASALSVAEIDKNYTYTLGGSDTIDIASLLSGATTGEIGSTSYTVSWTDNSDILSNVKVSDDGQLTYNVAANQAAGSTATITVTAEMANYEDTTITINIALVDKTVVELQSGSVVVTGDPLTYGDTLSNLTISQGTAEFVDATTKETVSGTVSFADATIVPDAGTPSVYWIFTPTNSDTYATVTGTVEITVNKATPTVTAPTVESLTYNPSVTLAGVALTGGSASWTVDGSSVTVEGSWSWADPSQIPTVGNSGYRAVFTPTDGNNYNSVEVTVEVTVAKAMPVITTAPTASGITYGQTLSESTLSGGAAQYSNDNGVTGYSATVAGSFAWSDTSATTTPDVSDSNSEEYEVIFTPSDTNNYDTVTTTVTVAVSAANLYAATVTLNAADLIYNANSQTPAISSVIVSGSVLEENSDYTVSYLSENQSVIDASAIINAGTYYVQITGTGNYTGTATTEFVINPASIAGFTYTGSLQAYYTGTERTFTATELAALSIGDSTNTNLKLGADDFTIEGYTNNVNLTADSSKATVTIQGTGNYTGELTISFDIVNAPIDDVATATKDWTNCATITAPTGYTISTEMTGSYASSFDYNTESASASGTLVTYYLKADSTGYISAAKSITVFVDTTAPVNGGSDGITISDKTWWKSLVETITFGLYQEKNVTITATDALSGIGAYYYYVDKTNSTTLLSAEALAEKTFVETTDGTFALDPDGSYVIYAYAVDNAGNRSTYFCSDGVVLDTTAPTLTLTEPTGDNLGDTTAQMGLTSSETGNYYYVVSASALESGGTVISSLDALQTVAENAGITVSTGSVADGQAGTEITVSLTELTGNTTYYVYVVAVDAAGNESEVQIITFTTDQTTPTVSVYPTLSGVYGTAVSNMILTDGEVQANGEVVYGSWIITDSGASDIPETTCTKGYELTFTPASDQYTSVTVSVIPTVTKKAVTVSADDTSRVYGTSNPTFTFTVPSDTLVGTDIADALGVTLSTDADATSDVGTYLITGTASSTNYDVTVTSGTLTVTQAMGTLTLSASSYAKTLGDSDFNLGCVTNGDGTISYVSANTDVATVASDGTVTIVGAGTAEITVSLAAGTNYTAAEDQKVTITVAQKASSDQTLAKSYSYATGSNGAVTIGIAVLLPTDKGTTTYSISTEDTNSLLAKGAAVDGNGSLTYTVNSVNENLVGETAAIKVAAVMANYTTATITVNITVVDKKTVMLQDSAAQIISTDQTLTYGDMLSALSLNTDAVFVDANDTTKTVSGTLSIVDAQTVPNAGTAVVTWLFTPNDDTTYAELQGTVSVTVNKATPNVTAPTVDSLTYNPSVTLSDVVMSLTGASATWTVGGASTTVEGDWNWVNSAVTPTVSVSEYEVVFTPSDNTNYESVTTTVNITVEKATPSIASAPTASAITYGQTLSASTLSGGSAQHSADTTVKGYNQAVQGTFSWSDSSVEPAVSDSGSTSYTVVFKPTDTDNYNEATTSATVTVNQMDLSNAVVTLAAESVSYSGAAQEPSVSSIVLNGNTLTEGTDYTVSYLDAEGNSIDANDIINVGTYSVVITGTGNYTGEVKTAYAITPASIASFSYDSLLVKYNGKAQTFTNEQLAALTIQSGSMTLQASDFEITGYSGNVGPTSDSSQATVTITGKGNYTGTLEITFEIAPLETDAAATVSPEGWTSGSVTVTAPNGYTICATQTGNYASSFVYDMESGSADGSEVTYYLMQNGTGYITAAKTVTAKIDRTAPEDMKITISTRTWLGTLLETITFGVYTDKNVTISATDTLSGVSTYYYYVTSTSDTTGSTAALTATELNELVANYAFTEVTDGKFALDVADNMGYVVYAYVVDKAGNRSAYFSSDGLVIGASTDVQTKLDVTEGLKEVPEGLQAIESLDTVEEIETALKTVVDAVEGYTEEQTAVYEVELMVSVDGGSTWYTATEENFPANGLTIILPYPDGTDKDSYDFVVTHMFTVTSSKLGTVAGNTEQPAVTKLDSGIQVTLRGLSPVAIGWKAITPTPDPVEETEDTSGYDDSTEETTEEVETAVTAVAQEGSTTESAPTGDDSPVAALAVILLLAAAGIIVLTMQKKKRVR
ncbi:MAG: hypothetical protein LUG61_07715 [Lachnospiraceae bacterium]|nr:hypothetical protein [Lachnospiraceae bacterium]